MKITLHNQTYQADQITALIQEKLNQRLADWEHALFAFLNNWLDATEFVSAQSSGSTGVPKAMELSKKQMIASAKMTNQYFNLQTDNKVLLCLSANYIAGKMMIVRAFVGELHLIITEPCSCPLIHQTIEMAAMVPMQVETMLSSAEGLHSLSHIKQLIIGGSAVSASLDAKLQTIPTACFATYGMTETVSHIALRAINGPNKSIEYQALNGVRFELDKQECLVIHAPHLQKEAFVTNDIVKLSSFTSFEWLGRFDNVINSGGIKLFPEVIEAKIADLFNKRFFIASLPDEKLGEKVILVIEGERLDTLSIHDQLEERLTRYEMPRETIFIAHFAETNTGKVKRIISRD